MRYLLVVPNLLDMRKSYHTLSGLVQTIWVSMYAMVMYSFSLGFHNRIKLFYMEPGGLVIYSKLLEEGRFRPLRFIPPNKDPDGVA
ncbi:hypothetical protein MASR1M46_19440 [Bacteroidales bacterium]